MFPTVQLIDLHPLNRSLITATPYPISLSLPATCIYSFSLLHSTSHLIAHHVDEAIKRTTRIVRPHHSRTHSAPANVRSTETLLEFNGRPDHLIAIIKQRLKIPGNLGHLYIAILEPRGRHCVVFYHPPPSHKEIRLEIPFDPPVQGYEDARARLYQWRHDALVHFKPVSLVSALGKLWC